MTAQDTRYVLAQAFTSQIFDTLRDFWFSHLEDETHIIVPSSKDIDVWFVDKSDEFDESCRYVSLSFPPPNTLAPCPS